MKTITADKLPNMHSTEFRGIPVVIQWPKGSVRVGEHEDGTPYKTEMKADYGYVPDTVASGDEERLDVYIGPNKDADNAYVIEQLKDNGEFDEYKVMLGYDSLEEAEESYYEHVDESKLGDISEVPFDYLFDRVMEERGEDQEQEREELGTEIKQDEQKVADHDDKLSVIDAFIKLYKHEVDFYEEVAHQTADLLEDALTEAGIRAIVTFRAKRPRKLRGKLVVRNQKRQYQSFRDIYDDIVDLAGVRVALYLPADRAAVGEIIEQVFAPVRAPKQFPRDRGPQDGMGYVATHYLVQLRPETLHKDELRYADTNIEIQVASVLMHAWSEVTHDLIYKPEKGTLTPEEMTIIKDLNDIVQAGEAKLEELQESVEARNNGAELRFELAAALTKLGKQLAVQSKGKAKRRIGAADILKVARQASLSGKIETGVPSVYGNYLGAKIALWKAHKADELDDRLREAYEQAQYTKPEMPGDESHYIYKALKQLYPQVNDVKELSSDQYSEVIQLAQSLKTQNGTDNN
jgi:ppGpp synthetase/RelA/SpoT-type nucleotidyltranferase